MMLGITLLVCASLSLYGTEAYNNTWASIDTRPTPDWYDEAKIGIFLHWGVYAVPGFGDAWFWSDWKINNDQSHIDFMEDNYAPGYSYQEFAKDFTAEFFDPVQWANIFQSAGARYVVLTSKHHEGYTLWPSPYSWNWNAEDIGPHRDLVAELASAIRENTDIRFGLYYSLYEWFNPLYVADKNSGFETQNFVNNKVQPEMIEMVNRYLPEVIWSDGDWEATDVYWKSTDFISWLYTDSPVADSVVINDRWGTCYCCHGDFYNCADRYNPGTLQPHKWENAMTIDLDSWGYRRNLRYEDVMTPEDLVGQIASTVSCGGNILINAGPKKDGTIDPIFEERLRNIGTWLGINGEAIYGSTPWTYQNDTLNGNVWYTATPEAIYAISLQWPANGALILQAARSEFRESVTTVTLLGNEQTLEWTADENVVTVQLPNRAAVTSQWAWTVKIQNIEFDQLPLH